MTRRALCAWLRRSLLLTLAIALTGSAAWSYWSTTSDGPGAAAVARVDRGAKPAATVTSGAVTISWAPTSLTNGDAVSGYVITRYDSATLTAQTTLASCSDTITTTACTETAVPVGSWVYSVTPLIGAHWRGAESLRSDPVVVRPPGAAGVNLRSAKPFSVLGFTGVTSIGVSSVSGDLGVSPSSAVTGFPPGVVGGDIHRADTVSAQAQADLLTAYDEATARPTTMPAFAGDLNGTTFLPGVRYSAAAMELTGTLTLDGGGDPDAVFIFQIDAALDTAAASHVVLINGAKASNVFWQVDGAAGTGANSTFSGTILAAGAITLGADSVLIGRALSRGAVTMASDTIRFTDAMAPAVTIDGGAARFTKDPTPVISGTTDAMPGRTMIVTLDGQTLTAVVRTNGTWEVVAGPVLPGTYQVVARIRDAAGNAGSATQQLTAEMNPAPVALGPAATYSVLGRTGVVSSGATNLSGDVGAGAAATISGFPPGVFGGSMHAGDAPALTAQAAADAAYADAASRTASSTFSGDQSGQVFMAGVHHTSTAFALTGTMTFDADGDPDAVFIIQVDAAMDTAAGSTAALVNGAKSSNIYWQVVGAASIGAASTFRGTILAQGAVTLGAGTSVFGRALSHGTVTLTGNVVTGA